MAGWDDDRDGRGAQSTVLTPMIEVATHGCDIYKVVVSKVVSRAGAVAERSRKQRVRRTGNSDKSHVAENRAASAQDQC